MVMKLSSCACLLPLACSLLPSALAEGFNGSLDFEQRINGKTVLKTIEPIRERLQDLSAVFFSGHDVVIYGIVLSPDGYIATKASELHYHQNLVVRIGSSKYGHFKEIGTDPATDIAVVKVDAASLPAPGPVSNEAAMGMMVVSNGSTTRTSRRPQLGTLSAARRPIPNGDTAYMGVIFGTPCSIQEVVKDGPAAKAGAMAGDEILEVDGTPITTLEAVSPILSKKEIGEKVTLKVRRKGKKLSYAITLGSRRQALGEDAPEDSNDLISGGFSKRRDDFPMVLQHDTPSRHTLMGGPLLNLKGELIGMNIARVNRAENYALPISVVQESVQRILKTRRSRKGSRRGIPEPSSTPFRRRERPGVHFSCFSSRATTGNTGRITCPERPRRPAPSWAARWGHNGRLPSRARCRPGERPWRGCPSPFCSIGAFPWFRGS